MSISDLQGIIVVIIAQFGIYSIFKGYLLRFIISIVLIVVVFMLFSLLVGY